jgi:uncharacterized protein (DUF2062 family)
MAFMFGREPMFVHLITLCLGLIIAYGLLQIVELFQRRRRERRAREAAVSRAAQGSEAQQP